MKKKAVLFLSLAFLMLFASLAMTSIVSACNYNTVPATNHGTGAISDTPGHTVTTPSGLVLTYGEKLVLTGIVTIGSVQYNNYAVSTVYSIVNPNTGTLTSYMPDTVWYFGIGTGVSHNGFIGCVVWEMFNSNSGPPTFAIHANLHGFGSFAGQTLKFDTNNPDVWTGYCIIR